MSRSWILLMLTVLCLTVTPTCSSPCTVYFLLCGTERITDGNFNIIKNAVKEFVNQTMTRKLKIDVGVIMYSTVIHDVINASSDAIGLLDDVDALTYPMRGGTNTHLGINRGRELLASSQSERKVMVVIKVGSSIKPKEVAKAAGEARKAGIEMIAVGVDEVMRRWEPLFKMYQDELRYIAGSNSSVFNVDTYGDLEDVLLEHTDELCPVPNCERRDIVQGGHHFVLNETKAGTTFTTDTLCQLDNAPLGMIECKLGEDGAIWGQFNLNRACNLSDIPDILMSTTLRTLAKTVNASNIEHVLNTTTRITRNATLSATGLVHVSRIFEQIDDLQQISPMITYDVTKLFGHISKAYSALPINSQDQAVANRVLKTMDDIPDRLTISQSGSSSVTTDMIGLQVWDLGNPNVTSIPIGLRLGSTSEPADEQNHVALFSDIAHDDAGTEASIILPKEFLKNTLKNSTDVRLSMGVYPDPVLFRKNSSRTGDLSDLVLNSKVISAKILVDGQAVTDLGYNTVTIIFKPDVALRGGDRRRHTVCAYWNFTGNGSWSTDGCRYSKTDDDRDVCECNHLTNFAILMDYYGQNRLDPRHVLPLTIITYVGLCASIAGLSITVLSFIMFRQLRQTQAQKTLFNLALAELCSWVVFLAGINHTESPAICISVAAMLHYFILVSFMWMLAEAVLHYLMFVKVLGTYTPRYMLKVGVPAWTIPLVPVIVLLVLDSNLYKGGDTYCWMSLTAFYYAFLLPVGVVILCNTVLYIMIVANLCQRSKFARSNSTSDTSRNSLSIRASVVCFLLLGLSWIFGFLAVSGARILFQYLFCITCTTQGLFIFIFMSAQSKQFRSRWRKLCCDRQNKVTSKKSQTRYSVIRVDTSSTSSHQIHSV